MTIWKYPLEMTGTQALELPAGASVLVVQTQDDVPCLWALVDPDHPVRTLFVRIVGTGHEFDLDTFRHVGTFQLAAGALVFHVFVRWEL